MKSKPRQTAETEQKERERHIIEAARRRSNIFPAAELVPNLHPDFLIPSARLGIEVSEVLPERRPGARFSGPQLSSFQESVVVSAEECYYALANPKPANVLVYFKNDWTRKQDVMQVAQRLARFVLNNYPSGTNASVTLQSVSRGVVDWVDGLSVVRIARAGGAWQAGGAASIHSITYNDIAERIAEKNLRLTEYRKHFEGWHMWLLLATRINVLHSLAVPRGVASWQFRSGFDKVILSSWEDGVQELQKVW